MRRNAPAGPEKESLEKRLAIASILSATGLPPEEPVRLGRLEVQSKIGSGAMGVVYRAWDPKLERLVAVKLVRGWSDDEELALLAREARALAQLNHPNVVAVYDIVDEGPDLCFVMEHVAGVTLRAWLDDHPEAEWREVLEWYVQVGRGVMAAHRADIIHQDLKPANVLVGDDGRARVADFGLARWRLEGEGGLRGGTPRYMAPEVAAGRPATQRADQFSLCRALEEALEGKDAPREVADAIARGLSEDPEERFPSLDDLLALLEAALEQTGESRARRLLLERVERLWLQGILERSLAGGAAVELALKGAPELGDSPWEPWGVEGPESVTRSRELQHLLRASNGALLLVGPPGAGKTTLLLSLCRELLRSAQLQKDAPAPVVLSLSAYRPEHRGRQTPAAHFRRWIIDEIVAKYGLPRRAVRRWFHDAGVVLLLDGLDETAPELRDEVIRTLNAFREEQALPIVVTCRDTEYEALEPRLAFGGAARLQPLDDDAVTELLEARHARGLLRHVDDDAQLRNPLLLTLLSAGGAPDDEARRVWKHAYQRYVEQSLEDARPAERGKLRRRLGYLARFMRDNNASGLWLEDLRFSWIQSGVERGLSWFTGALLIFAFGVGLNLLQTLTGNSLASSLTFGLGVSICSFAYTRGRIRPVERLRWSWRRMLRLLPVTTVLTTLVGLAEALRVNFWANLAGAAFTGALLAVAFALDASDRPALVRPNAGIRRSLYFALLTSIGFGLPAGLLAGLVFEPFVRQPLVVIIDGTGDPRLMAGASVGIFVSTALFLIYGGTAVIMHFVLRAWLALRTPLPFGLTRFLDHAVELGLMRQVGGGYVFLHRTLLDHFADQQDR
jgi:hypothetical protein